MPIDLRSDTVTRPTEAMRRAMFDAEVGDDVTGDDPTVNRLQDYIAGLLGKEAALFVPSGTMANQIAIRVHTRPGDELLCEETCHIYEWEAGAPASLSGVTCRTIRGDFGMLTVDLLKDRIRPDNEHYPRTRLLCLENTHNRGGGRVIPQSIIREACDWAHGHGLVTHLDGARLWNAAVASGRPPAELAAPFDSVSVCFSKGLGAPVGSALAGSAEFVHKARRTRKMFGGGMRQAGLIAAAALFAVENHLDRLAEDHKNAQTLAAAVRDTPGLTLAPPEVETNLVWVDVDPGLGSGKMVMAKLKEHGVLAVSTGPQVVRMCTHLDASAADVGRAADIIRRATPEVAGVSPDSVSGDEE